jgi:putative NADPH-quinone reductase
MQSIVIFGSARSHGNTRSVIDDLIEGKEWISFIDLSALNISEFDYDHKNQDDDFIPLMEKIVQHDRIILVTPVYWYSVSTRMKIFLDRWSDVLKIRKDLGRALKGKRLFIITTFQSSLPKGFEDPFIQLCEYMEILYEGCSFIHIGSTKKELFAPRSELGLATAEWILSKRP